MSQVVSRFTSAASISRRGPSISVKRIRFVPQAQANGEVVRTFDHPRPCAAVAEPLDLQALPTENHYAIEQMIAMVIPPDADSASRKVIETWMGRTSQEGPAIAFAANSQKIQWRPGRAVVQSSADGAEDSLAALIEFSFYESELRRMEASLAGAEAIAPADVARAHRIRFRDRKHWKRIGDTIEALYRMRLEYARLESQLVTAPLSLSGNAREIMERLIDESGIDDRMEAFSNRLEACEDLYEGANDRIADHRWYVEGHWLEIAIVLLLVLEVVLISTDLYLKHVK